jgi:hypothetical protein
MGLKVGDLMDKILIPISLTFLKASFLDLGGGATKILHLTLMHLKIFLMRKDLVGGEEMERIYFLLCR